MRLKISLLSASNKVGKGIAYFVDVLFSIYQRGWNRILFGGNFPDATDKVGLNYDFLIVDRRLLVGKYTPFTY